MEPSEKYLLSFTAASLSISESIKIAEVYLGCKNWNETKKLVEERNLLQSRTSSRSVRTYQELAKRLQLLTDEQLAFLTDGNVQEQKYLLWFTSCKRYKFIKEFAIEVIHEKFISMDQLITDLDYDAFFNRKADWHEELDEITGSTKDKLKQVVFRMLVEAGITNDEKMILPAMLSERFKALIRSESNDFLLIFPSIETGEG